MKEEEEALNSDEYEANNRSMCSISSDELDGDLNLSDSEEYAKEFRQKNKAQKQMRKRPARKF